MNNYSSIVWTGVVLLIMAGLVVTKINPEKTEPKKQPTTQKPPPTRAQVIAAKRGEPIVGRNKDGYEVFDFTRIPAGASFSEVLPNGDVNPGIRTAWIDTYRMPFEPDPKGDVLVEALTPSGTFYKFNGGTETALWLYRDKSRNKGPHYTRVVAVRYYPLQPQKIGFSWD
jgi:hypothetical protein